ncbi:methanogen extracellular protein (TIGR04279 family) [Methanococcus maripaludis]|uniref:Methanogen extracellular protein (TIGR04279 family) n=1 Tax=Methanococcus maripaludis TaxID=39152 RepID=A0A7J9S5Y7_METMI|nr:TIGR04279 domain-containing protein [Methanococcus maripaludis]MBB6401720.1 methanogen extracellular protein (TIGR04279 family) [Methanococcus maripaludis]
MKIINFFIPVLLLLSAIPIGFAASENVVVIASTPADAILAAQYAKEMGYKFVYTPSDSLSEAAENAITGAGHAIMIGGPDAISETVKSQLEAKVSNVERVYGVDRVDTSLALLERMYTEKPEALNNIVFAEGFNGDITPAALNFGAPIAYFAPDNYEKVSAFISSHPVKNAVIMGSSVPDTLRTAVSNAADTTNLALGSAETIIETALSVAPNLNPSILGSVAALVYSESVNDPVIDAILGYASGDVGSVVPLPSDDESTVNDIVSSVTSFTSTISISSDSSSFSESISEATPAGTTTTTTTTSSSSSGGSSTTYYTQYYTVVSINNVEKVKFADISASETDGNNVKITGEDSIVLPDLTIKTEMAQKSYAGSSGTVKISYQGTGSGLNMVYPVESYALTYGSDLDVTFYGSRALANKQVTAHIIADRQEFRDSMNDLLDGNADTFISMLNNADTVTSTTNYYGDATFTATPSSYGENIVLVTLGDGTIGTTATVLGVSGFEYLKYDLNLTQMWFNPLDNTTEISMDLNETPTNNVRYGLIGITKSGYSFTFDIIGTSTADKNFDVSLVGNGGTSKVIDDSALVSLTASSIQNILEAAFTENTAGITYSYVTKDVNFPATVSINAQGQDCYFVGVVYDLNDKKIVAMEQISGNLS